MLSIDFTNHYPANEKVVEERKAEKILSNVVLSKSGLIAKIIKIPPKEERMLTFSELPRTQEDESKIGELISTLGKYGKVELLLNHEKKLRKMGDELRYLHPFKFLGYVFSHKDREGVELKKHMAAIFDDYFKRTNFLCDFTKSMDIYDLKNQFAIYLNDFAREISIDVNKFNQYFDKNSKDYGKWEEFLRTLIMN